MGDIAIRVEELSKKYQIGRAKAASFRESFSNLWSSGTDAAEFWALKEISFEVKKGEAVGIIGRNGAGKSTLLKILSQITFPTSGKAEIYGRVSSLLEVGTGFHPELTGRENVYLNGTILGMRRNEVKAKFEEIVAFSAVEKFIDTPIKHYSSGMKVRLAFSVAAHLEPEILIIDEVLAVGDYEFQKRCLGKMEEVAGEGRTVLFVSHNLTAIRALCGRGICLQKGEIVIDSLIDEVIHRYNGAIAKNCVEYTNEIVKKVWVLQDDTSLMIHLEYQMKFLIDYPLFGFSISDVFGVALTGTNSLKSLVGVKPPQSSSGIVKVRLSSPKLSNGEYFLSIWFGDRNQNYFQRMNCMSFDVIDMKEVGNRNPKFDGYIIPECDWEFDLI